MTSALIMKIDGLAGRFAAALAFTQSCLSVLLRHDGIGSITERTKRVHIDKTRTEQLRKLLQADESYGEVGTHCMPLFGARLVLHLASPAHNPSQEQPQMLTLDLCFHCGQVSAAQDGKKLDIQDFSSMQEKLLKLFRDLFPTDAELAAVN